MGLCETCENRDITEHNICKAYREMLKEREICKDYVKSFGYCLLKNGDKDE